MSGLNNWLKIKYDHKSLSCELDFSDIEILPKEECLDYTIKKITERYDNLYLCLSGGLDSEFVANALLKRGVKFTPVIVDFEENRLEAWYAYLWCKTNKIKPLIIRLSNQMTIDLFSSFALKYSTTFVSSLEFILHTVIDGHLLFGSGDPFFVEQGYDDTLSKSTPLDLEISSFDFALELAYPGRHPGSFFEYTPSMLYCIAKELDYSKPIQLAKAEYYGINPRPKVSAKINVRSMAEIAGKINSLVPIYTIQLGSKDSFLDIAERKGRLQCKYK